MNKTQNIFIFHFSMFKQILFILGFFCIWKKIAHCCKDNVNAFKLLIFMFVLFPIFFKQIQSFAFEIPDKFGHGFIVLGKLPQNNKIQCCTSGFNLADSTVEGITKGVIVSDVLISSGTPEGEAMIGKNTEQSDTYADKGNDDWSVYVGLLPMIFIFLMLMFSEPDEERRKRNRR